MVLPRVSRTPRDDGPLFVAERGLPVGALVVGGPVGAGHERTRRQEVKVPLAGAGALARKVRARAARGGVSVAQVDARLAAERRAVDVGGDEARARRPAHLDVVEVRDAGVLAEHDRNVEVVARAAGLDWDEDAVALPLDGDVDGLEAVIGERPSRSIPTRPSDVCSLHVPYIHVYVGGIYIKAFRVPSAIQSWIFQKY